jgi:endonuclease/exonuclease/phosphatase (EEP) superfamily protein YafD
MLVRCLSLDPAPISKSSSGIFWRLLRLSIILLGSFSPVLRLPMPPVPIFIRCLSCGQKLRVPPEKFGVPGNCPRCKTPFPAVESAAAEPPSKPPAQPRRSPAWVAALCWAWLALVLIVACLLHGLSEEWWINTLLLYSPRWLVLVPTVVLLPLAALFSRPSLGVLAAGGVAWLLLVAGFTLHLPTSSDASDPACLRVLTCNMQGRLADAAGFQALVARTQPDVVLLQEWSGELNQAAFPDLGWTFAQSGHLWVASRLPIKPAAGLPAQSIHLSGSGGAFEIVTPGGTVRLVNVHLPTPREGISAVLEKGAQGLAELRANTLARSQASSAVRQFAGDDDGLVVTGDFNLPVESSLLHKYWGNLGNAFSRRGWGFGWTKFTGWHGVRIDQILFGPHWTCLHCEVGPDIGSDHRAVFAVLRRVEVADQ